MRRWWHRGVPVVLGLLLLVTAGLKAFGWDALTQDSAFYSPRLLVAAIEVEIVLGLWLLSGWWARPARLAGVLFFAGLALASGYLALTGQKSCGCLGSKVTLNPWIACGVDVAAVLALLLIRPAATVRAATYSAWLRTAVVAPALLAGLVILGFWALVYKPAEALARLRGDYVTVEPALTDMGEGSVKENKVFSVRLKNHSGVPVKIIGGTASCSCVAVADLPITIPPYGEQVVRVGMTFKSNPGNFKQQYLFYTDLERQQTVAARFLGRVASTDATKVK